MARSGRPAYFKDSPLLRFGERVRTLRHARTWSQEELGSRANLHPTYVSSCERGERNASILSILAIADALDVDPALLFTRDAAAFDRGVAATKPVPAKRKARRPALRDRSPRTDRRKG